MRKTSKVKRPVEALESRAEAQAALASYADAEAKLKKIEASIEEKCAKIREQYTVLIEDHQSRMTEQETLLQDYAEYHPEEFKEAKSLDLVHGMIGFRTGKHQVKTLKGFTWDAAINLMKSKAKAFLRTKVEVAKDKIITERMDKKLIKLLPSIGLEIVQDETFFIETKSEELVES